jgi:EpsI family protein
MARHEEQTDVLSRRFIGLNTVLACIVILAYVSRAPAYDATQHSNFLKRLPLPFLTWSTQQVDLTAGDLALLQPDAFTVRNYKSPDGRLVQLAVVAGHKKRSVHTPAFCMTGGGWETVIQRPVTLHAAGRLAIPATEAVLAQDDTVILTTYFFTDGSYCTNDLLRFQGMQLWDRVRGRVSLGALVRIITPMQGGRDQKTAEQLTNQFATAVLPAVLANLQAHQQTYRGNDND